MLKIYALNEISYDDLLASSDIRDTIEEAYKIQTEIKKKAIRRVANEYKDIIPEVLYNTLLDYKFNIENDKNYIKSN